ARFLDRHLRQRGVELPHCLQLSRALRTSSQVLFHLVTSIIFQLVVDVERDVFSYPITFHLRTPNRLRAASFEPTPVLIARSSQPVARSSFSSHLRQRATQLLRGAKQRILCRLFRRVQHFANRA